MANGGVRVELNPSRLAERVEPMLFGLNFEVTRETWYNGISAQIINNRKFYAYGDGGEIAGWRLENGAARADGGVKLPTGASVTQTLRSAVPMRRRTLCWRVVLEGRGEVALRLRIGATQAEIFRGALDGGKHILEGRIVPEMTGAEDCFALEATRGEALLRCVSLMPEEGTVLGLREDVISALKALKPACLRFPGGCYAEYYDWHQGFLPPDDRACVTIHDDEWLRGIVQGPTFGQDPQDMSMDDFVTVCRMVGAEPQYTVRLSENTPEDAAKLVEYANGGTDTEYGRLRASRGFEQPFGIRRWYVGNELYFFGRGGLKEAEIAAERSVAFARAMKRVDPSIELILCCQSGSEWNQTLLKRVKVLDGIGLFSLVSFHQYLLDGLFSKDHTPDEVWEPATEEGIRRVEDVLRAPMEYVLPNLRAARREQVDFGSGIEALPISYDEWNYCWGRRGHPVLALFTAGMLQMLTRHAAEVRLGQTLFFHPINEGILRVTSEGVLMEDGGLVWKLVSAHRGGIRIVTEESDSPVDIAATLHGDRVYLTLLNRDARNACEVALPGAIRGRRVTVEGYAAQSIWERAYIANGLCAASADIDLENETLLLPPTSVFGLWIE